MRELTVKDNHPLLAGDDLISLMRDDITWRQCYAGAHERAAISGVTLA